MLKIDNIFVSYGGIEALKGISIEVKEGQIVTLVGANGAGKSTTLRSVVGLVKPSKGNITFEGKSLLNVPTHQIVKSGISLVPEGRRIFADLTVLENLKMGAFFRKDADGIKNDMEWVYTLFPRLKERTWQLGGTLSGGEQQMLAVARALMAKPRLLMMDEPSLGLAPLVVKEIFEIIKKINSEGITVLLIEQNANVALHIAHIGYVLETGNIKLSGPGKELLVNEEVKKAYLGESVTSK